MLTNHAQATTTATSVSQLVTSVAIDTRETAESVYSRIFSRLALLYGFDVYRCPKQAGESLLGVALRYGWLNEVYSLAYAEHLYQQQYEE